MRKIGQLGLGHLFFAAFLVLLATAAGTSQPPSGEFSTPNAAQMSAMQAFSSGGAPTSGPAALVGAAGEMIGFSHSEATGTMTITLVHTGKSWMAVYHIDRTGTIRLVSSRAIDADFSLQLNAASPLPEEIRKMGKAR